MAQTLLGFDFGRLRIGVAVGNTVTGTANALTIVESEPLEQRWKAIASLIEQWRPDALVVGRPAAPANENADAQDAEPSNVRETAARCERFARQLAGRFRLPVQLVDESGTSLEAAAALVERRRAGAGKSPVPGAAALPEGRRGHAAHADADDAEAAAIILRQYLSLR